MTRKKTQKVITNISVAVATILAWLSGYFVMQIVYDSVVAAIIFSTVWAVIVFCESRFSHISLKSDGRVEITKEEIKSNLWQIIAAGLVAILVSIPLELKIYAYDALMDLFSVRWFPMTLICMGVIVIFQTPIFIKMAEES